MAWLFRKTSAWGRRGCTEKVARLFAVCMIGLFSAASAAAAQSGDLLYKVVGGTEITITGYAGSGGALTLPEAINGLPVTRIGTNAFEGRTGLTGVVTIPDSVVSIGRQAFAECDNLGSLPPVLLCGVADSNERLLNPCDGHIPSALCCRCSQTLCDLGFSFSDGNVRHPRRQCGESDHNNVWDYTSNNVLGLT